MNGIKKKSFDIYYGSDLHFYQITWKRENVSLSLYDTQGHSSYYFPIVEKKIIMKQGYLPSPAFQLESYQGLTLSVEANTIINYINDKTIYRGDLLKETTFRENGLGFSLNPLYVLNASFIF